MSSPKNFGRLTSLIAFKISFSSDSLGNQPLRVFAVVKTALTALMP